MAGTVGFKGDLGIDDFVEELPLSLRENLHLRLAGGLREKRIAFAGDGQNKIRGQLELPHVTVNRVGSRVISLCSLGCGTSHFKPLGVRIVAALAELVLWQRPCASVTKVI